MGIKVKKKDLEYIWDYYKFHILVVGFLIYAIVSALNYWVLNPPKDTLARIVLYEKGIDKKKAKDLEKFLNKSLNPDLKSETIKVDSWDLDSPRGLNKKLQLMIAAQKIDVIVSGNELIHQLQKNEILDDLDGVSQGNNGDIFELSKNDSFSREIFYYKNKNFNAQTRVLQNKKGGEPRNQTYFIYYLQC